MVGRRGPFVWYQTMWASVHDTARRLWWPEVEVCVQGPANGHVLRVYPKHHGDLALCPGPDGGPLPAIRKSV
jgi:hypothetical protein